MARVVVAAHGQSVRHDPELVFEAVDAQVALGDDVVSIDLRQVRSVYVPRRKVYGERSAHRAGRTTQRRAPFGSARLRARRIRLPLRRLGRIDPSHLTLH